MLRWYHKLSIKFKILLLFYVILVVYSVVYYIYSTRTAMDNTVNKVGEANIVLLRQMAANISFMRSELEDMSTQLVLQPQVQEFVKPYERADDSIQKQYIDSSLRDAVNLIVSKDYFASLAIVGFENRTVPFIRSIDRDFKLPEPEELVGTDFFKRVSKQDGKAVWSEDPADISLFGSSSRFKRILMARTIKEYTTYREIGFLLVSVSESALRSIYTEGLDTGSSSIAILTADYELLSGAGHDMTPIIGAELIETIRSKPQGYMISVLDEQPILLSYMTSSNNGWVYLYGVPMNTLTEELNDSRQFILLFLLTALALIFPMIWFATELIIRPIRRLLESMRAFQTGDFGATVQLSNRDEIGALGLGYNEMVRNIKNLVDRMYLLQIKEREAELSALQAQINPHFLYNTLDTIYWKAQKKRQEDIAEMVWHLSRLLRLSLNKGKRMVTVKEELGVVEEYLSLQGMRYGGRIRNEISAEPEALDVFIPKLIIQPFVENAVLHGLEKKEESGLVRIICRCSDGFLVILVDDDGVGIKQGIADALVSGTFQNSAPSDGGYAISNIRERLELQYTDAYSFTIEPIPEGGTRVRLSLPLSPTQKEGKT